MRGRLAAREFFFGFFFCFCGVGEEVAFARFVRRVFSTVFFWAVFSLRRHLYFLWSCNARDSVWKNGRAEK